MSLRLSPNLPDDFKFNFRNDSSFYSYSYDGSNSAIPSTSSTSSTSSKSLKKVDGISEEVVRFIGLYDRIMAAINGMWEFYEEHPDEKIFQMYEKMSEISDILFASITRYIEIEDNIINNYINSLSQGITNDKSNKKAMIKMLNKEKDNINMNIKKFNNL